MNRLGTLLGGTTRANIVEGLALSGRPLTAYRIARKYNMNIAKTYAEMKKLVSIGMVEPVERSRWNEYTLADDDLRRLAVRLSSRVKTYEAWRSPEAKRKRFRMGLARVPPFSMEQPSGSFEPGERRLAGELESLAVLGRKKFDAKYLRLADREYARV